MRRKLCIATILTGVASVSAAETSYKACQIDGSMGFFSFTEVGDFVEVDVLGSALEPFLRPASSVLFIEVDDQVLIFGDDKATLLDGDELTQFDCYWMSANQVAAFNEEASQIAANLELQLQLTNELAVDLRLQLAAADTYREKLDINLANAILAQAKAEAALERMRADSDDLEARLAEAILLQYATEAQLEEARAALAAAETSNQDLTVRLAAAIAARDAASTSLDSVQAALDEALARVASEERQRRALEALLDQAGQAAE